MFEGLAVRGMGVVDDEGDEYGKGDEDDQVVFEVIVEGGYNYLALLVQTLR
jgi:hypothetical protein